MSDTSTNPLKTTPLNARHKSLGARMVSFGGWDMPADYSGITEEHMAVRTRAGLFDVSHMGEIEVAGSDAILAIQNICSNDVSKLSVGQAHYSALTTQRGTFIDDLLVYRIADDHLLLVVNAANIENDYKWIKSKLEPTRDAVVVNASQRYALLAIQGPEAIGLIQTLTSIDLASLKYYWFATGEVANLRVTVSRTGYTGEDGVEIFVPPQSAERLWDAILETGKSIDIRPAGLGARDTLRLEASMRLHGMDIDETTSILEAGLGWIIGWTKPSFIGSEALRRQKVEGPPRKLVGFEIDDKLIARHGYSVYIRDKQVGQVSSGTRTPFLKKSIGMTYLPSEYADLNTEFEIDVRGKRARARVVPMPFYRRSRS